MRYAILILLLASCSSRQVTRVEKIQTRTIDTTVTTPKDIIYAVRPLTFLDTVVVENERVRTEVIVDTVFNTIEVTSEVKEYTHDVKATEVTEIKEKDVEVSAFKWYTWYFMGVITVIVFIVIIRMK